MKLGYYKVLRILVGVKAPTDESAVRTKVHEQVAKRIVSVRFTQKKGAVFSTLEYHTSIDSLTNV